MQSFTKFDRQVEQAILQKVEKMDPSENMFGEINKSINRRNNGGYFMRNSKRTRGILVACILLVLATGTCFAAAQIASITGCVDKKFESYPSESQMKKVAGFLPEYVEEFQNGYKFKEAFAGEMEGKDAGKNSTDMVKMADFTYIKGDAKLYLNTIEKPKNSTELPKMEGKEFILPDGQKVFYHDYLNKLKPADYVMTEQDKKDKANGTYVFSFGEDYDSIQHVQMIDWEEDSIRYSLSCLDDELTKGQLLKMVEELVKK